jgi:ADP-heptose:LPS heptosyltransferase
LKYGVLIHWLQKKFSAQIFLSGGPEEKKKTSDLNRLIGGSAFELAGALSWEGTTSLLNHIDLVVSGNTGIMHLAAAKQKKQVALHGPTNAAVWGPLNPNARNVITSCSRCPCLKLGFEYHTAPLDCMNMIEVDQVKEAVSSLI